MTCFSGLPPIHAQGIVMAIVKVAARPVSARAGAEGEKSAMRLDILNHFADNDVEEVILTPVGRHGVILSPVSHPFIGRGTGRFFEGYYL